MLKGGRLRTAEVSGEEPGALKDRRTEQLQSVPAEGEARRGVHEGAGGFTRRFFKGFSRKRQCTPAPASPCKSESLG